MAKTLELELRLAVERLVDVVDRLDRDGDRLPVDGKEVAWLRVRGARLLSDARSLHGAAREVVRAAGPPSTAGAKSATVRGSCADAAGAGERYVWVAFDDVDADGTVTSLVALAGPGMVLERGGTVTVGDVEGNRADAEVLGVDEEQGVVWLRVDLATWTAARQAGAG